SRDESRLGGSLRHLDLRSCSEIVSKATHSYCVDPAARKTWMAGTSPAMTELPRRRALSKSRKIFRHHLDLVFGGGLHQVGHSGIVAARARAEVEHGLLHVFARLPGKPRLRAVALIFALMAAGAADRAVGALRLRGDLARGSGLAESRPGFLGEI